MTPLEVPMESLPRRAEGSGALARVLTILLALVLLPLSTVSLAFGTSRLGQHLLRSMPRRGSSR